MARRTGYALSMLAAAACAVAWVGAQAESHVRIIRLSYIDGQVQMQRAGQAADRAMLNAPVTEGATLVTGHDGLAEVEFENNTSMRLGENSEVRFTKLVVDDAGAKVNEIEVLRGTVYVDTKKGKEDVYRLTVAGSTFLLRHDSEMRLSSEDGRVTAAVTKGEAAFESQGQEVKIGKKETLTVNAQSATGYEIAKGVEAAPLDRWNSERSAYQTAYSYNNYNTGPKINAFGYSDLSYYGTWGFMPGVGYGWQPYGVAGWAGWNPYTAGAWMYDPALGYSWASAYPWGWLPYHYGAWYYGGNGAGWYWVPGQANTIATVNGFQTAPVVHGPSGWRAPTTPPAVSPAMMQQPTVKVGMIGNMPASIPGGRPVPDFRSLAPRSNATVQNRSSQPTNTFTRPQNPAVASTQPNAVHNGGHVFEAPRTVRTVQTMDVPSYGPPSSGTYSGSPSVGTGKMSSGSRATTGTTHTGAPK